MDKQLLQSSQQEKIKFYSSKAAKFKDEAKQLKEKHFQYSVARLIIFILGIAGAILAWNSGVILTILVVISAILSFLFCLFTQFKLEKQKNHFTALSEINVNEVEVLKNQNNLYCDGSSYEVSNHFYSLDLDIFGPFSLFKILNRAKTYLGLQYLAVWLSQKPSPKQLHERHEAVQELESAYEFRQEIAALLFTISDQIDVNPAELIKKGFMSDFSFAHQSWLRLYSLLLPILWLLGGTLYYYSSGYGYLMLALLGMINFGISLRYAAKVNLIQNNISTSLRGLSRYADVLAHIYKREWKSTYILNFVRDQDADHSQSKIKALQHLSHLIVLLDYRLHMIPSIFLNIGLLWDSRIVAKIEQWKSKHPELVDEVFEIIGNVETISSLSTWAFNHEHYSYAQVENAKFSFYGKNLVHPLMKVEESVGNDFIIEEQEFVSIITGSNMSGKSTMLRTLGLNMVLAYAGTRVAASELKIPIVQLITYMRIKDALEENVSTFKAELNRVQQILELIHSDENVLILIDEMLRGTNSKDKLKGSIAFVNRILEQESHAVIATHDIQLTEMSKEHPSHIKNYFFDITFSDQELEFDYKIKEGICDTFNASFLLAQMGLTFSEQNTDP